MPEEGDLVGYVLGLALAGPVEGVGQDDETDEGIASGFGEDSKFCGGVGIERARSGGFGGVVYGEPGPDAVSVIGEMQGVADQRESEKSDGAESENGGDSEGGVFFVGIDGALRGDDSADAADGGTHGEERCEFGLEAEEAAKKGHESERARDFNGDEEKADAAEFGDIAEKKARAKKNDARFEPEFVGGNTGSENFGQAEDVGDDQADENGPQDVLDVGKWKVVSFGIGVDISFEKFAREADGGEKGYAGEQAKELGAKGDGGILGECDCVGHGFSFAVVKFENGK